MTKQEGWCSASLAELSNFLTLVMQFPCPGICCAVSLARVAVTQTPCPGVCYFGLPYSHSLFLMTRGFLAGEIPLWVNRPLLGSSPIGVPSMSTSAGGKKVTKAWPMGISLPGFWVWTRAERDVGVLSRLFAMQWFMRNTHLVMQITKIYFSHRFGLHSPFLVQSSQSPWNFLCRVIKVSFVMRIRWVWEAAKWEMVARRTNCVIRLELSVPSPTPREGTDSISNGQ